MGLDVLENVHVPKTFPSTEYSAEVHALLSKLKLLVEPQGFEVYPFLIGWYNETVEEVFQLKYPEDTVAFLFISTPSMFEKAFVPFVLKHEIEELRDPIDQCMLNFFRNLVKEFAEQQVDMIHDFELHPNKRPKILAQTAAHVSGAAFLYRMQNLSLELRASPTPKRMMGLCLHPKYGGWFAIRGCIVLKDLHCPDLPRLDPIDILTAPVDQMKALELFNFHWRDSRFRDVVSVEERYSKDQQLYFNTPPGQRKHILADIRKKYSAQLGSP
ncbi:Methylmalonic aciduria and homocystinuria type C protein-like protein [Hypsibius exemplaris]|uniref:Cyanocobalamin reductase (cyanide-eliminating) n=1 Tax=Hypsibius exemplaris TaxID=2072580 RepID=A0A1W0WD87_HYPEX|nr:Methylmalonic aciduria and homocystinuria type C protein-like protein [Hypsibius exemplaris]